MIRVVGVGADGFDDLPSSVREAVLDADAVLGGARHLAMLPAVPGQRRDPWPSPLRDGLPALLDSLPDDASVVVLASGDPMVSGIGSTLARLLGADAVEVVPAVSSVALARAEMRWAAESCAVVSVVGRPVELVARELAPGRRILVLSTDEHTPVELAGMLTRLGFGDSVLHVLGNLGTDEQSHQVVVARAVAGDLVAEPVEAPEAPSTGSGTGTGFPRLNIVAVQAIGPRTVGWTPGLPDDAYENDGQITRRDIRASALARLQPVPGEHLWDVGGGSGSIGIEWMRSHPSCRTTAIEANHERAERIGRNARNLGVPGLRVLEGHAPEALDGLDAPDAIFIGGGATVPGVLDACLTALRPGGRLVVHGVTLETELLLAEAYKTHGGELTRMSVETSSPIGRFTGWSPSRTITQWSWQA